MAKPKPPRLEPTEIPKRQEDELDQFLERLYFRIRNNVDAMKAGELNAQWVAFEALGAVVPVLAQGFKHADLKGCYPIASWRNDTVEVPREIIEVLAAAWNEFEKSDKNLGQSFGFEKLNRQGSKPMKSIQRQLDKDRRLSNAVLLEYTQIGNEVPKSLESARVVFPH